MCVWGGLCVCMCVCVCVCACVRACHTRHLFFGKGLGSLGVQYVAMRGDEVGRSGICRVVGPPMPLCMYVCRFAL